LRAKFDTLLLRHVIETDDAAGKGNVLIFD